MRIGLISDIHASYRSLSRALDLLAEHNVSRVFCMGDIVESGTEGDAVVRALQDPWITCVQGNHDRNAVARAREGPPLEPGEALLPETLAWLDALPLERRFIFEGVRIGLAHAAPGGVDCYVFPDEVPRALKRVLRTIDVDVFVLGHTHVPMWIRHRELHIINPGSVRGTRTRDSHTCAILELPQIELTILPLA